MGMKMGRSLAALSFNGGSGCYGLGSTSLLADERMGAPGNTRPPVRLASVVVLGM